MYQSQVVHLSELGVTLPRYEKGCRVSQSQVVHLSELGVTCRGMRRAQCVPVSGCTSV